MATFQLTMQTAVWGYNVYIDVWIPTVDEEVDCWQELNWYVAKIGQVELITERPGMQ